MKLYLLIFAVFIPNSFVFANETQEGDAKKQSNQKGEEIIWLEEKISPTTTWVEGLFKPLTVWIEQQINEPESDSAQDETGVQLQNRSKDTQRISENGPITDVSKLINDKQATTIAKQYVEGDILYLKLIRNLGLYRVKLISNAGEIHVFYIDAISGDIVLRDRNQETEGTESPTKDIGSNSNLSEGQE